MNVTNKKYSELPRSAGLTWLLCGVFMLAFMLACASSARAAVVEITAKFSPSPLNPSLNTFVNTTPQGGFCVDINNLCPAGTFSIASGIRLTNRTYDGSSADPRLHNYIGINASERDVVVQSEDGSTASLKFRVNILSHKVTGLSAGFPTPLQVGLGQLYTFSFGKCTSIGNIRRNDDYYYMFHSLPNYADLTCYLPVAKTTKFNTAGVQDISFRYSLIAPNPLQMKNGVYKGSIEYRLGKNLDLDLGEATYPAEPLILNFTLTVQHEFAVSFPPGSDKAILEPVGGWSNWLSRNRAAVPLRRELGFNLSSSGPFTMHLECQYFSEDLCALKTAGMNSVFAPFDVSVMMPGIYAVDENTAAGSRTSLNVGTGNKIIFGSSAFAKNRASRLIFEMSSANAEPVLDNPGKTFAGNVTLVIDSAL